MSQPLLTFKAGRSFRREGSNLIIPDKAKGSILLYNEDGLIKFVWKDRDTGVIAEDCDLLIPPSDASFVKISERSYVLEFSSSDQKYFFWMQDLSPANDEECVLNVNLLLNDPEEPVQWSKGAPPRQTPQAVTAALQPSTSGGPTSKGGSTDPLDRIRALVNAISGTPNMQMMQAISLCDVLTAENLSKLLSSHPELAADIFPFLPSGLPVPPSVDVLRRIVSSPQFQSAVRSFDQALQTGLLGGLVRGLGLPEEAGTGVEPFLRSVQEQANKSQPDSGGDSMDTSHTG